MVECRFPANREMVAKSNTQIHVFILPGYMRNRSKSPAGYLEYF